jgi:spore germination protein YaaH
MPYGSSLLLLLAAAGLSPERPGPERTSVDGLSIAAWVTYWDLDAGLSRLRGGGGAAPSFDDVFLFVGALTPGGGVTLADDERAVLSAVGDLAARGTRTWLTIVNDVHPQAAGAVPTLKDAALVHQLLADGARAEEHQSQILALARRLGVSGIDIDYENLAFDDRAAFTRFIGTLSARTREQGLFLSVTVQPKTEETRSTGPGAADWSGLCPSIDRLQIMLYNLHSGATAPGPMATPEWMERVLAFAVRQCPASRVVPAVKLSGMDWGPDGVQGIQYEQAISIASRSKEEISRDASGAPFFSYDGPGGRHTVFYEDAASIEDKLRRLERLGFDRAILWSVGREDPALLPRLHRGS